MEFVFVLSKYNDVSFKTQVSKALEKRTELISRKNYPQVWKFIDKMNSMEKAPEEVLKRRHSRYKIYGILLLLLGFFILIPSLMKPKEMITTLLVGLLTVSVGILYLRSGRKSKKEKLTSFDKAAIQLFNNYDKIIDGKITVTFTDDKVQMVENVTNDHSENDTFDYSEIEKFFITEDLFVLIWNERITVLQKKDLVSSNLEEFINFITLKSQNLFEIVNIV